MINTYINDNANVPYPFFGMGFMPFPMCCSVGFGLCIHCTPAGQIAASSIARIQAVAVLSFMPPAAMLIFPDS